MEMETNEVPWNLSRTDSISISIVGQKGAIKLQDPLFDLQSSVFTLQYTPWKMEGK